MDKHDKIFAIADKITKFNFNEIWDIEGYVTINLKKEEMAEELFLRK